MLYLSAGDVAAALELMRRTCQPESRSLPHITARYSSMQVRPEALKHYTDALVEDLILADVTSFDELSERTNGVRTVVIRCESEDLEWLSYKPDFPDSVFHFTIYDGQRSMFALRVLETLAQMEWNLRIVTGTETVQPYEKAKSSVPQGSGPALTQNARLLLDRVSARVGTSSDLLALGDDDRIRLLIGICEDLRSSPEVESAGDHVYGTIAEGVSRYSGQEEFWTTEEVNDLSPELITIPTDREAAMFLTPPEVAYDMAAAVVPMLPAGRDVVFGDPAVGPGIFFAAMRQLVELPPGSSTGVEINPARAEATARRWGRAGLRVVVGDFLTQLPSGKLWTAMLANPPYVRHQHIDRPLGWLRRALESRVGIQVDGRSDLYVYFVLSAHDWLAPNGVASWLLPAEFIATGYGRALRDYFTSKVQIRRLHIYDGDSPLFDNARISSAIVIYEMTPAVAERPVEISHGGTIQNPTDSRIESTQRLRESAKWTWAALAGSQVIPEHTLGEFFTIKRGIATGANSYFVLDDAKVDQLDIPRKWIRPLLPRARTLSSTVVLGDESGDPLVEGRRWLIDTDAPLDEIQATSPRLAEYLKLIEREVGTRTLVRQRRPIYKQETRGVSPFFFLYMAKADLDGTRRFIWNRSEAVVLNNYLGLVPNRALLDRVGDDSEAFARVHTALGRISADEFQRNGRTYVSGLLKLEPRELAQVAFDIEALDR
jgi:adenine-specific DNA-methyltransferase